MSLDSNGKCKVLRTSIEGAPVWKCTRNLDSHFYPEEERTCFFTNCPGRCDPPNPHTQPVLQIKQRKCLTVKVCKWCSAEFTTDNPQKKYCSEACRKRSARKAYRDREKAKLSALNLYKAKLYATQKPT